MTLASVRCPREEFTNLRLVASTMADGTRMQTMDARINRHEEVLVELTIGQQTLQQTQLDIQGTLELILNRLTALERPQADPNRGGLLPIPTAEVRPNREVGFPVPPLK
ncbi:uncharacterized protein LOC132609393 [Lycium barbarum]|uniref:uncharacterized protein LOC132609393 n=1 Tax=Lycium barbarum TaxID=112863 RepID=UPI00293EDC59|nr:uncharacterized protein LOC132609393 [Lycium barbarum]